MGLFDIFSGGPSVKTETGLSDQNCSTKVTKTVVNKATQTETATAVCAAADHEVKSVTTSSQRVAQHALTAYTALDADGAHTAGTKTSTTLSNADHTLTKATLASVLDPDIIKALSKAGVYSHVDKFSEPYAQTTFLPDLSKGTSKDTTVASR